MERKIPDVELTTAQAIVIAGAAGLAVGLYLGYWLGLFEGFATNFDLAMNAKHILESDDEEKRR